jgi:arabinose-5-phosphate isomerase
MVINENQIIQECKKKIELEAEALLKVAEQVDLSYTKTVEAILNCKGRLIITGLGKTGHVGKKIAASFSSLGVPAFFVHSCESLHGDMGMITKDDVVIMISNSGKSSEILNMLPSLKIIGAKTISITKDKFSPLGQQTDISILCDAGNEIDHNALAPTTSSTATLAVGDALATVVSAIKNFKKEEFALRHPGGALGQKLLKEYQEQTAERHNLI